MPLLSIGELSFFYEEMGTGEPVLLLHGLGSSIRDWELQIPVFAQSYRVLAVDLRGHGRSAKPPGPYAIPMFAADIAAFIDRQTLTPVHLVGISLGGMIAFELAVNHPQLLHSLVIVNSVPAMIPRGFSDHWQLWRRAAIVKLMGMRRMGEYLAPRLFPKPEHEPFRQEIAERWAQNDKRAYLAASRSFVGWDVMNQLSTIRCPSLIISADEDYWPVSVKEAYTAKMPTAKLWVIEDSHHATPVDQADRFNTAVLEFWAGLADRTGGHSA